MCRFVRLTLLCAINGPTICLSPTAVKGDAGPGKDTKAGGGCDSPPPPPTTGGGGAAAPTPPPVPTGPPGLTGANPGARVRSPRNARINPTDTAHASATARVTGIFLQALADTTPAHKTLA